MTDVAEVVVPTDRLAEDVDLLTRELGFRIETVVPADAPRTVVVSGHGIRLRLERSERASPVTVLVPNEVAPEPLLLPGGSTIAPLGDPGTAPLRDPPRVVVVSTETVAAAAGRAGMQYRDLLPGRWGGHFVASLITIPDGGPVADYVHFHRIRFQLIVVKSGWVRVVYEGQGGPFLLHAGDAVLQPPGIRHRVLEASPGLEVVEIGGPAEHETVADWSTELPTPEVTPERRFDGQRFVHHVAADAAYRPWRCPGWEQRDTGIGDATDGLAGVRVARPATPGTTDDPWIAHESEFFQLVVLEGAVTVEAADRAPVRLRDGDAIAIPGGVRYRLTDPTPGCELLDVTLPADLAVVTQPASPA